MARRKFGRQDIIGSIANAMGKRSKPGGRGSAAARETSRARAGTSRPDIGKAFARKGGKGTQRGYGNMPEDVKSKIKARPRGAPSPEQVPSDNRPKQGDANAPRGMSVLPDEINAGPETERPSAGKLGSSDARNAAAEGTANPPASAVSAADMPPEQPNFDDPAGDRPSPNRPAQQERPESYRTSERTAPIPQPRSRTPSQTGGMSTGLPPISTEEELGLVQSAIDKPTPEALMELFEDPATHIKDFIGVYGEENVPDEIWSMLESPTGMPPEEYPYPGAMPPNAPMPPPGGPMDMGGGLMPLPPDMLMPTRAPPRRLTDEPPLPPDLMSELGGRGY